ncbi:MAG: heat-inducible transcriptional repressor HrcA [Geobacter sp.]|nr:heat-inducible transcriptional repressor HrcA [Geobacter sp.]
MVDLTLSQRSRQILEAIVEDYIATAEPVGSSAVARRHALSLSSATVRNVMASLEELGLLASPHTSAGRIPTDKGFRFYVDSLVGLRTITHTEKKEILKRCRETGGNLTDLLREASRTLSSLSNYTGIVVAPRFTTSMFRQIEFIKLGSRRILAILVTCSGAVQNRIIEVDQEFLPEDLIRMSNYLNSTLEGLSISKVREKILAEMELEKNHYDQMMTKALSLSQQALPDEQDEVYITGQSRIFEQPEFSDVTKMREIFQAFEEKGRLVQLLGNCMQAQGVQIFIGSETPLKEIAGMSLITSTYMTDTNTIGLMGVIGPTRMGYSSVIPIVDYTAQLVSRLLTER